MKTRHDHIDDPNPKGYGLARYARYGRNMQWRVPGMSGPYQATSGRKCEAIVYATVEEAEANRPVGFEVKAL